MQEVKTESCKHQLKKDFITLSYMLFIYLVSFFEQ